MATELDRRQFIVATAAVGGGMALWLHGCGPQPVEAAVGDRLLEGDPLTLPVADEVDQDDRIAHDDAGERDHADHRRRREPHRVGEAADGVAGDQVEQPETGCDADRAERDRQHDDER